MCVHYQLPVVLSALDDCAIATCMREEDGGLLTGIEICIVFAGFKEANKM